MRRPNALLAVFLTLALAAAGCTALRVLHYGEPGVEATGPYPFRDVPASGEVWALPEDPRPLGEEFHVTFPDKWRGNFKVQSGATLEEALADAPVQAFVVLHDGRLVYERYANGGSETELHATFSVTKPVVGALVGIAIGEGRIAGVDQPVQPLVPELHRPGFADLTIRHLLEMTSGIDCSDDPKNPFTGVNALFYTHDLLARVRGFRLAFPPGTHFEYRSADTEVLGIVLERATGMSLSDYLSRRIWGPAGMESKAVWSLDGERHGREKAFCGLSMTARDLARFGQLYLDEGRRGDRQIVPSEWVRESTRGHVPEKPSPHFGWQWWTDGEAHAFFMDGIRGQYLYVDREDRVVIAMFSRYYSRIDEDVFRDLAAFVGRG